MNRETDSSGRFASGTLLLVSLAAVKLLVHLASNAYFNYGFFRDEFYYIACGEHPAWGYVDHPPLAPVLVSLARALFGDSIFSIRLLPALAGALVVFLTGLIARELGGGRFAQALAATAAVVAPIYLVLDTIFSMNAFDLLFWTVGFYLIVLIIKTGREKHWYLLGAVAGIGLMNKISMLWFGFGLLAGVLLSPQRRSLLGKEPWIAALTALVIFLPHVLWQAANGFPTLEFMRNATLYKMVDTPVKSFLADQVILMQPLVFPLCLAGLCYYLFHREGRRYRLLGFHFLAVLAVLLFAGKSKAYYLAPAYPALLASGAVLFERATARKVLERLRPAYLAVIAVGGIVTAPLALPVLPVEKYISYQNSLGIAPGPMEKHEMGKLNQFFADMHGWEEMVAEVARVYNRLSTEEREECLLCFSNYGEAGAVDFLGRKYGLPGAICAHNNYFLWGPGTRSGKVAIVLTGDRRGLETIFEQVEQAGFVRNEYSMPFENLPVFLCRNPRRPLAEIWPGLKHYI
ncbi:MAG: glycosyltransferase family 39 protein [Candidatus Glassbacteria bacterium]|nr:glycosyltransferase family 39 protein [Candidatus Glassbacteria bacterium]